MTSLTSSPARLPSLQPEEEAELSKGEGRHGGGRGARNKGGGGGGERRNSVHLGSSRASKHFAVTVT